MIKKKSLVLILLCSSTEFAFAASPGNQVIPPSGVILTAPETSNQWTIGLEAQMMMPIDKFQYAQVPLIQSDGSILLHNESVDNEKDWGWEADVAYQFADTGRDIRFAYTDLNMSDTETKSIPTGTTLYGINGRTDPLMLTDGGIAYGTATYHYHAADLTMGQLLTIGQRLTLHPFAGLRYAQINLIGDAKYIDNNNQESKFTSDSTFNGMGPRAGMDVGVRLGYGFSLVGTAASSLLLGDLNENYKVASAVSNTENRSAEVLSVIPELDASLGINYHVNISPQTGMDLQFGTQVVDYFNADEHNYIDSVNINSVNSNGDFGYHGIYIRGQVNFV